jgi:hypothetical protein
MSWLQFSTKADWGALHHSINHLAASPINLSTINAVQNLSVNSNSDE